jgi:sugar O-acyltransferase (sialic acid O-acetyltransferase NeuD family)
LSKLLIVGAGGFGREVFQWARHIKSASGKWENIFFLDDNLHALDNFNTEGRIVGRIIDWQPGKDEEFVCSIGAPRVRMEICNVLEGKGAVFINIIHPTAVVGEKCVLGKGVIICPNTCLTTDQHIGDHVIININTSIGHDTRIARGCTLSAHCDVMGGAQLDEGVFMGSGARILPGIRVGKNAKVGAGSVVIRRVAPDTSVFGVPALKIE